MTELQAVPVDALDGVRAGELAARWDVPGVHLFGSVGSTNDLARALAGSGAGHGTTVIANEQLAGRGQYGRGWVSAAGLGIYLSMVVRPPLPDPALLPLRVGVTVAEALERLAPMMRIAVKWPNDLLVGGRKLAGILCEGVWAGEQLASVVVGIGLNLRQSAEDFPLELRSHATSIRRETGATPPLADAAGALARAILLAADPAGELTERLPVALAARDALRGRSVLMEALGGKQLTGLASGIAPDGALLVRTADGVLHSVRSGSVRVATEAAAAVATRRPGSEDKRLEGSPPLLRDALDPPGGVRADVPAAGVHLHQK